MPVLLQAGIMALLGVVAWQDLRAREVSLWVLLSLIVVTLTQAWLEVGIDVWIFALVNLSIMFVQVFIVGIWFKIRKGKSFRFRDELMGTGDLVFFIVPCIFWGLVGFVLYYIAALLITAIGFMIWQIRYGVKESTVPLAGGMALVLIVAIILLWLFPAFDRYDDVGLMEKIWL